MLKLSEEIPRNQRFKLFFDNWFSTLDLMVRLKSIGVLSTTAFRTDRLKGCPIASDKELKKEGRRSCDCRSDINSGVHVIKWHGDKCVHLASAFSGVAATGTVKRWDAKGKSYIDVPLPDIVPHYNTSMRGVDLADMLIALYRTTIMSKKRWYLTVIFLALDTCKVSGWLFYRRHCDQLAVPKKDKKSLLSFITELAGALRLAGK